METKSLEKEYGYPSNAKILGAKAFDFACVGFLSLFLSLICLSVLGNLGFHKDLAAQQNEISYSSCLFMEKEGEAVRLDSFYDEQKDMAFAARAQSMNEAMTYFYGVYMAEEWGEKGVKSYLGYKASAKYDDKALFSESGERLIQDGDYDVVYYTFYKGVYAGHAVPDLFSTKEYTSIQTKLFIATGITVFIGVSASYFVVYLFVPSIFHNGKRTFGMMIVGLILVKNDGEGCSFSRFLGRFFANFVIVYLGSFATLFIVSGINAVLMLAGKTKKGISDFIFKTNLVSRI